MAAACTSQSSALHRRSPWSHSRLLAENARCEKHRHLHLRIQKVRDCSPSALSRLDHFRFCQIPFTEGNSAKNFASAGTLLPDIGNYLQSYVSYFGKRFKEACSHPLHMIYSH